MAEVLDQSDTTGTIGIGFGDDGAGRKYMAMGFQPDLNNITSVSFYMKSKDADTNIGIKLWIDTADSNSNPANGVDGVGGVTILGNGEIVTTGMTKYALDTAVSLTAGNQYCFVAVPWNTNTSAVANSYHDWQSSTSNPYTKGRRVHLDSDFANPSAPDGGNADLVFETYGNQGVILHTNLSILGVG